MKVLFINKGKYPDYMSDLLLHGFYNLLGHDLTHTTKYEYMYQEFMSEEKLRNLYGNGFTVFGTLEKYFNDNSDIEQKIKNNYFNYIIYSSIYRDQSYLDLVNNHYKPNQIAIIDGEDHTRICKLKEKLPYFKRELLNKDYYPISFSIPQEKILKQINTIKIRKESLVKPKPVNNSYLYNNEQDYYNDYRQSYFGLTNKKGGWDCMRHYEILGNYCVPYFPDIYKCPINTMVNFPKKIIQRTNFLYLKNLQGSDEYYDLLNQLFEYTKQNLITTYISKYVLDTLKNN